MNNELYPVSRTRSPYWLLMMKLKRWADTIEFYAKTARYDRRYAVTHFWQSRLVWVIIRLIPRDVKKYVVVQAAVRASNGNGPDTIGYKEMYEVYAND